MWRCPLSIRRITKLQGWYWFCAQSTCRNHFCIAFLFFLAQMSNCCWRARGRSPKAWRLRSVGQTMAMTVLSAHAFHYISPYHYYFKWFIFLVSSPPELLSPGFQSGWGVFLLVLCWQEQHRLPHQSPSLGTCICGWFFIFSPVFLVPTRLFQSSSRTGASSALVLPECGTSTWPSRAGRAGFCWDWSCVKPQQCYLTQSYPRSAGMLSFPAGHRSTVKKPKVSAWNWFSPVLRVPGWQQTLAGATS